MLPSQPIAFPALQTQLRVLANIQRPDGKPRYFFRGQSQHWLNEGEPTITPTIDRPQQLDEAARDQALMVCLQAKLLGRGIDGYPIPNIEHAIGILRHYSWPTPALDITDDPDVALWFALNNRANGGQAYMLVLDSTTFAQEGIEMSDLWFTPVPLASGGLNTRFLRQSGWLMLPRDWRAFNRKIFDLAQHNVFSHHFEFLFPADFQSNLPNLMNISGDPLPWRVQDVVRIYVDHLERQGTSISPIIKKHVDGIAGPLPSPADLTLETLGSAVLQLPRWHALTVVRRMLQAVDRCISSAGAPSRAQAVEAAVNYARDASKHASPQPPGHDYSEVRRVAAAADAADSLAVADRAIHEAAASLISVAQVYTWDTSAYAGLEHSIARCAAAIQAAAATGSLCTTPAALEQQILAQFRLLHSMAQQVHRADVPVDLP